MAPLLTAMVTLKLDDVADQRPLPEAVSVRPRAAVLIVIPEKVANPEESVLIVAPEAMVFADGLKVIEMLLSATALP